MQCGYPPQLTLMPTTSDGATNFRHASAVVAAPEGPLVVRSRRAGDRVRAGRRDVSLKRFLMDRRVPADVRPLLPLVAVGNLVLWVPGQPAPAPAPGARYLRFDLQDGEAAR